MTAGKTTGKDERAERLATALKENLRRRKAQARGRAAEEAGEPGEPGQAPARPAEEKDR